MSVEDVLGLLFVVPLLAYLVYALLFPERL
jgi:K+-transporting ATPase KdpF subunit